MNLILWSVLFLSLSGLVSLLPGLPRKTEKTIIVISIGAASLLLGYASIVNLMGAVEIPGGVRFLWQVPLGSLFFRLDSLSALFLLPLCILPFFCSIFGHRYLQSHGGSGRTHWFFYNLLISSMVLLLTAHNSLLFLLAWEGMTLSSFFLILHNHGIRKVRKAGILYLSASHIGIAALIPLFILLGKYWDGYDFQIGTLAFENPGSGIILILAIVGFGLKAGIMPLHIWLPEAHPASPSHISALLSGAMLNMGIYGLLRILSFFKTLPASWGIVIILLGIISSLFGIILALIQKDLKRLLAYSSIENMGILFIGIGTGVLGAGLGIGSLLILGFTGAFLHMLNHSLYKGALFLTAGSILQGTGTTNMERLGGLFKKMPFTALAALLGTHAICALPPLNGFLGKAALYLAYLRSITSSNTVAAAVSSLLIFLLVLVGGLTLAAFIKFFSIPFLGSPRAREGEKATEVHKDLYIPALILSLLGPLLAFSTPFLYPLLEKPLLLFTPISNPLLQEEFSVFREMLLSILLISTCFLILLAILFCIRHYRIRNRILDYEETWGCGYIAPTPRMQYTGSSFVEPLETLFRSFLHIKTDQSLPKEYFPKESFYNKRSADPVYKALLPLFKYLHFFIHRLKWVQHGRIQLYILYILVTLIFLLFWIL